MKWSDQQPVAEARACVTLTLGRSGYIADVERVRLTPGADWQYRLTVGNLFGSESVIHPTADAVLVSLDAITKELARRADGAPPRLLTVSGRVESRQPRGSHSGPVGDVL